jgi:hypothetical protein
MDTSYVVPSERYARRIVAMKHRARRNLAVRTSSPQRVESGFVANARESLRDVRFELHLGSNVHHSEAVLSKNRTDFDVEASNQSTHFCGIRKQQSKCYAISLKTTLGLRWIPLLYEPVKPVCE